MMKPSSLRSFSCYNSRSTNVLAFVIRSREGTRDGGSPCPRGGSRRRRRRRRTAASRVSGLLYPSLLPSPADPAQSPLLCFMVYFWLQ